MGNDELKPIKKPPMVVWAVIVAAFVGMMVQSIWYPLGAGMGVVIGLMVYPLIRKNKPTVIERPYKIEERTVKCRVYEDGTVKKVEEATDVKKVPQGA